MPESTPIEAVIQYDPIIDNPVGDIEIKKNIINFVKYCSNFRYDLHSMATQNVLVEKILLPAFGANLKNSEIAGDTELVELIKIIATIGTSFKEPFDGLATGIRMKNNGEIWETAKDGLTSRQDNLCIRIRDKNNSIKYTNISINWINEVDKVFSTIEMNSDKNQKQQLEILLEKIKRNPEKIGSININFVDKPTKK